MNLHWYDAARASTFGAFLLVLLMGGGASAQQPTRVADTETELLAAGWAALASKQPAEIRAIASRIAGLDSSRRSAAALAFLVEAAVAQGGPAAALVAYEQWLSGRKAEEVYTLRRIGVAVLTEAAAATDGQIRAEALDFLAADGDANARRALSDAVAAGQMAAVLVAAERGDVKAVATVLGQLESGRGNQMRAMQAIAQSGDARAIPVLMEILARKHSDLRVPAAEALAKLGATKAVPQIRALLDDPVTPVRFAAAAALFKLGDASGLSILESAAASEHSGVRVGAAEALSSRPDAKWRALVEGLAGDPDPMVRVQAAQLLAPHDPQRAARIMSELTQDPNPGIREMAGRMAAAAATDDVTALRQMLGQGDPLVRVRAAGRLLALTR